MSRNGMCVIPESFDLSSMGTWNYILCMNAWIFVMSFFGAAFMGCLVACCLLCDGIMHGCDACKNMFFGILILTSLTVGGLGVRGFVAESFKAVPDLQSWSSRSCQVIAVGIRGWTDSSGRFNTHYECTPAALSETQPDYTSVTCEKYKEFSSLGSIPFELKDHSLHAHSWSTVNVPCLPATGAMMGCYFRSWAYVDLAGIGRRCAGRMGDQDIFDVYTGDHDSVSWKTVCEERDDLLRRNDSGHLHCWINVHDDRVAFAADLPGELHLQTTFIETSTATYAVAICLGPTLTLMFMLLGRACCPSRLSDTCELFIVYFCGKCGCEDWWLGKKTQRGKKGRRQTTREEESSGQEETDSGESTE
eukprot:TRINITY_DN110011_c0_g1_i1.p1 TRINITY_DN110011_c0_g1~~TRINITY_DN110011_c0_g1_i1.p1  ORF type:complete len:362 (-),score=26.61 TRINITY_DN110011_c0_g1_i1:108-1193(-)